MALSLNGEVIFNRMEVQNVSHASQLGLFGWNAMNYVRENGLKVDAVAVSAGPGSYTGLRIGVSEAKGIGYGLDVPLIALSSLKVMASGVLQSDIPEKTEEKVLFCPMIDARRMEVYSAIYDKTLKEIRPVRADIIDENSYAAYLQDHKVVFFGDGSDKCRSIIRSANALFVKDIYPLASAMVGLAEEAYSKKDFVDLAYFEPFYLKEFQATVAKNKVIPKLNNPGNAKE
ncbi:MAG: tRNA (adenosine(37)-N6)-threonylcarbamoyltransferase complex dimerization subunit type 1 TsaB [Bacteroidales bacterium]|nr:tRNA (adenosine(37)-N6)-threonylcarbamoyltransferase complex dimerization subunit type 1 TsaB [Bacteroidales bacterium]